MRLDPIQRRPNAFLEARQFGLSWYALAVESHHERKVADRLDALAVENWLLLEAHRMIRRCRVVDDPVPFLPGYLLVRLDLGKPHANIEPRRGLDRSDEGVDGALCLVRGASPWPTPIPAEVVGLLRTLCDSDGVIRPKKALEKLHNLVEGQEFKLTEDAGSMCGLIGRVLQLRGAERLWSLIDGKRFDLPASWASPISKRKKGAPA